MINHRHAVLQTRNDLASLLQDMDLPSEVAASCDEAYKKLDEYYLKLCLKASIVPRGFHENS